MKWLSAVLLLLAFWATSAHAEPVSNEPAVVVQDVAAELQDGAPYTLKKGDNVTVTLCIEDGARCLLKDFLILVPGNMLLLQNGATADVEVKNRWAAVVEADKQQQRARSLNRNIVAWGDSLTWGSGAKPGEGYPNQIEHISSRRASNQGVGGETAQQILARMQLVPELNDRIVVIWAGRNDVGSFDLGKILGPIAKMVELTDGERYLVLSVTNGLREPKGSKNYKFIAEVNQKLKEIYGDHFLDVREALVAAGEEADSDWTLTDRPPQSIMNDDIHFKAKGYNIVANAVLSKIDAMNW